MSALHPSGAAVMLGDAAPPLCPYNDPDADIVLVSNDDVEFRVHSHILKTHRHVF